MKLGIYKAAIKRDGIVNGIMGTSALLLTNYLMGGFNRAAEAKAQKPQPIIQVLDSKPVKPAKVKVSKTASVVPVNGKQKTTRKPAPKKPAISVVN